MEHLLSKDFSDDLDDIDECIIDLLRKDGRIAFAQIAQQLNVSPGMIRIRFNRMVKLGLIKVVVITNPVRKGFSTMTLIGIRAEGEKLLLVAQKIAEFEEVVYLIIVSGRYDLIAEVVCRDHADLLRFLTEKLYRIEGVRESETFVHLKIEKEVYF